MSDDTTPQQIVHPFHKQGIDTQEVKGPAVPENPLLAHARHLAVDHQGETTLSHVHITDESVATFEMTPPHAPRKETAAYEKARSFLIEKQDKPCVVCGVTQSTLSDPVKNLYGAQQMEAHHYPIERSLMNACDPEKVHHAFPEVIDEATLEAFVDSPRNLIILCDVHHRSEEQGIHHLLTQDFAVLPYLYTNYQVVAKANDKDACEAKDDQIEKDHNMENDNEA